MSTETVTADQRPLKDAARPPRGAERGVAAPAPPSRTARVLFALGIALACGAWTWVAARHLAVLPADLGVARRGAQALLQGLDPYASVGPGRRYDFPWPLLYPMPAVLMQLPLAAAPDHVARVVFIAVTAALAAYGVTRESWHRALLFTAPGALVTVSLSQWSFGMLAAATVPAAAWVVAVKPNIGLCVAATWSTRRQWVIGAAGALVLAAISFIVAPGWLGEWRDATRAATYAHAPAASLGGLVLLALAAFRWRRPEGRLLAALALVPHTPAHYDALLLFLVPATFREALVLACLAWIANVAEGLVHPGASTDPAGFAAETASRAKVTIWLLYVPCALMVLRRPNEGAVPAWLDRGARHIAAMAGARARP